MGISGRVAQVWLFCSVQALPPEMRKQIEEKRNTYLAKTQAQQVRDTLPLAP